MFHDDEIWPCQLAGSRDHPSALPVSKSPLMMRLVGYGGPTVEV